MSAGLALRGHRINDEPSHSLIMAFNGRASLDRCYPDVDDDIGGRQEPAYLPPIDQAFLLERSAPEWRRVYPWHPPRDDDLVALDRGLDSGFKKLLLSDGA